MDMSIANPKPNQLYSWCVEELNKAIKIIHSHATSTFHPLNWLTNDARQVDKLNTQQAL